MEASINLKRIPGFATTFLGTDNVSCSFDFLHILFLNN